MPNEYAVTTNEIMDFLKENMATKNDIKDLQGQVNEIKSTMATKDDIKNMATKDDLGKLRSDMIDYMDKKFFDFRGDLVILARGEDKKLFFLVDLLVKKNVLSEHEAKSLAKLEPFPQSV